MNLEPHHCAFIQFPNLHFQVTSLAEVACWMVSGERQAARIRCLYLKAILRQEIEFFDNESTTGEVISRMSGGTILIQDAIGEKVEFLDYKPIKHTIINHVLCVTSNYCFSGWQIHSVIFNLVW